MLLGDEWLSTLNKKLPIAFDKFVLDHSSLKRYMDILYPKTVMSIVGWFGRFSGRVVLELEFYSKNFLLQWKGLGNEVSKYEQDWKL